jgi:nucleoside-diphosphate-sugar epimerase/putative sterol carrier protein
MIRSVAVTGASGSLGTALLEQLCRDRDIERIVAIDRKPPPKTHRKIEFVDADVRDPAIAEHFAGCEGVVHLAFIVEKGSRDLAVVDSVNVGGSRNVFEAAAAAGVDRVVYASSIVAYGAHEDNRGKEITEDAPTRGNPEFYYARTKAEVELWLDKFESAHPGLAIARLRPSVFLSGGHGRRSTWFLRQRLFPYFSGPDWPVHVTHEDDVARAFVLALEKRATGAYNVATSDPLPMSSWAEEIGAVGLRIPHQSLAAFDFAYRRGYIDLDPVWFKAGAAHPIVVSTSKIRRELGWTPQLSTTGDVLRHLAGRPTRRASLGTRMIFGTLASVTALRGRLPADARAEQGLAGITGSLNIVLTGLHPSAWHVWIWDGAVGVGRGIDPRARATVTLAEPDFFDLLTGKLSYSVATMVGKIRLRGDGGFGMIAGGVFGQMARAVGTEGQRTLPQKLFSRVLTATQEREQA